jgi:hypothetical protein
MIAIWCIDMSSTKDTNSLQKAAVSITLNDLSLG